jgi:hypothetical protein
MLFTLVGLLWTVGAAGDGAPALQKPAAKPMPLPEGRHVVLRSAQELRAALEGNPEDITLLLADGVYTIETPIEVASARNVLLRSESSDPTKVTLRGRGFLVGEPGDDILRLGAVHRFTIAHITFAECRSYAVQVRAERFPTEVHIYDCHFRDIGIRAIKGSTDQQGVARGGSIRHCHFQNSRVPPAEWLFDGNYITAIDMMSLDGWTIADNTFLAIRGRTGEGRGAIFIWVRSRNVVIERNLILGCDRGISLGNPSGSTNFRAGEPHVTNAVVRNNVLMPGPDAAIELWWVTRAQVLHNTLWREDARGRGIRGGSEEWPLRDVTVAGNLVHGALELEGEVEQRDNLTAEVERLLRDSAKGDLRPRVSAEEMPRAAGTRAEVADDYFGRPRPERPALGAIEP